MVQVHEKIRVKGSAKQYKTGRPGLSGQARLERRVHGLLLAATRCAQKGPRTAETDYAARLAHVLYLFVAAPPPAA